MKPDFSGICPSELLVLNMPRYWSHADWVGNYCHMYLVMVRICWLFSIGTVNLSFSSFFSALIVSNEVLLYLKVLKLSNGFMWW